MEYVRIIMVSIFCSLTEYLSVPSIMIAWGLVMTLMCLCKSFEGLIAARVFLGLTEAGLFPGITFYLSLWYRRRDTAQRLAIFFSAATIAGAFGGLLAWGIEHMEGIGGLYGWQWIVSTSSTPLKAWLFISTPLVLPGRYCDHNIRCSLVLLHARRESSLWLKVRPFLSLVVVP